MPEFKFTEFLTTGLIWWSDSPGVITLCLLILAVVCWIALVRWLENRSDLNFVRKEIEAAKREVEAERKRRQMDAVARISDRRRG